MKKYRSIVALAFLCFFASAACAAQSFDASSYKMQGNYVLHQTLRGELRAGQGDFVIKLIGEQPPEANYNKRLFLEVTPPKGKGNTTLIPLQENVNGFEPRIELRSFVEFGKNEIFLSVSGADRTFKNKFYIIELREDDSRFIFDSLAIVMPIVKGNFRSGYQLRVLVLETAQESLIDLAPRRVRYAQRGIYDTRNGALRKQVTTWGGEFVTLEPVDVDGDGLCELRGLMVMYGTGPGDPVAQIMSVLKYKADGWNVLRSNTAPAQELSFWQPPKKPAPARRRPTGRIVRIKRPTPAAKTPAAGTIGTTPASQ